MRAFCGFIDKGGLKKDDQDLVTLESEAEVQKDR